MPQEARLDSFFFSQERPHRCSVGCVFGASQALHCASHIFTIQNRRPRGRILVTFGGKNAVLYRLEPYVMTVCTQTIYLNMSFHFFLYLPRNVEHMYSEIWLPDLLLSEK